MGLVAVHSGAGNSVNEENYRILCKKSSRIACDLLDSGGSALDACEKAISILEDSPNTNAGFGSNLTWDGKVECEAGIMESSTNFGACSCVTDVKNPISLARKICDKQSSLLQFGRIPPMMLAGDGASYFARETGLKMISSHQLISKKSENMYNYYRNKIDEYEKSNGTVTSPLDTVGAVAIDNHGNVAAGCSSGGIILKLSGRVGQAASFGAGCWSQKIGNHSTACCTTGNGEYLIKTLLAREICIGLQSCNCPTTKLNEVFVEKFLKSPLLPNNQESYGGALIVDYNADTNRGDLLWAHTTKMICVGYKSSKMKSSKFVASTLQDTLAGQKVIVSGIPFSL